MAVLKSTTTRPNYISLNSLLKLDSRNEACGLVHTTSKIYHIPKGGVLITYPMGVLNAKHIRGQRGSVQLMSTKVRGVCCTNTKGLQQACNPTTLILLNVAYILDHSREGNLRSWLNHVIKEQLELCLECGELININVA